VLTVKKKCGVTGFPNFAPHDTWGWSWMNHKGGTWRLPLVTLWFLRGGDSIAPPALCTACAV